MKVFSSLSQVRLLILSMCVCILLTDTFVFYEKVFSIEQVTTVPEDTEYKNSPLPSPTTSQHIDTSRIQVISFTKLRTVDKAQIEAALASFVSSPVQTQISEVSVYQLSYKITGRDGSLQPVTAKVYLPTTDVSYPLFVFGSGTTGLADKCAPSLENMAVENIGNYENQMISQSAMGYVSVFPDYEGFHSPEATQAYFISESEAKVLLGAIKSLLELQSTTAVLQTADLKTVFLAGYSQGGHAALSTAAMWKELPSDVRLKGVIQFAGAADVEALFLESPWLASYLVDSYAQYYGSELDSRAVLQDRWLVPMAKNNETLCVNDAYKYFPHIPSKIYSPAFMDAIETHVWPANLASWQKIIQVNTPDTDLPDVPYLSLQGEVDPIVTALTQHRNVEKLCQQHKKINYREYPGVNHFQIRQNSFQFSNEWMKNTLAGNIPKPDCP